MSKMNRLLWGCCCLGFLMAGSAQAMVWKCKDTRTGQIEYSDIQCDGSRTVATTLRARPNELDTSGSRQQAALQQRREQEEDFQRQAAALKRQAAEAASAAENRDSACSAAESAYESAKASYAAPARMQGLKNQVFAACGRAPASATPVYSPAPKAPSVITSCDDGGCWGSDGTRYNGGTGGTYFRSDGKVCQKVGVEFQCM